MPITEPRVAPVASAAERRFGLRDAPFLLSPDARSFFPSRVHAHAMVLLKYGLAQAEGFVVVTGEIGAGKTTLVRTLLDGLPPGQILAAQVLSTQHDAHGLLGAVAMAYGVPLLGRSKARAIATLEAFLTAAAAGGRRTLLVVDEAQNLGRDGLEELRMLTNLQIGPRSLLQVVLAGQPELRATLQQPDMEQLRQRIVASCHLGPLEPAELRPYVEHRLTRVGWRGEPDFDDGAFKVLHAASGGIPRRVHTLCNRILLACTREGKSSVRAALVQRVADELRGELGLRPASPHRLSLWRRVA